MVSIWKKYAHLGANNSTHVIFCVEVEKTIEWHVIDLGVLVFNFSLLTILTDHLSSLLLEYFYVWTKQNF